MTKKLLIMAVALTAMIGLPAVAQNPQQPKQCTEKQCTKKDCDKKDFDKKCTKGQRPCPFEGLQLTESQKAAIDQLQQKRQARQAEMKKDRKAQRQQADSAARFDRQKGMRDYLTEVKAILTPDQYVVFLENMVVNQPQGGPKVGPRGHKGDGPRLQKDGRHFRDSQPKGPRPDGKKLQMKVQK